MTDLNNIKHNLEQQGFTLEDFEIQVENGEVKMVKPKKQYIVRKIIREQNRPVLEDINEVAELSTITAMDKDELAEMLVYALIKIDELEARMNG